MRLQVETPAKINLSLLVGPRRSDGYHDLFSVFMPVGLADCIEFDLALGPADGSGRPGTIVLDCESVAPGAAAAPAGAAVAAAPLARVAPPSGAPASDPGMSGEDNLLVRALRAVEEEAGRAISGVVRLEKQIPVGAGMGGGSSDAAAALRAAARLLRDEAGVVVGEGVLQRLAVALGADVPFFLDARPATARGIGEVLRPIALPRLALVLLFAEESLSTAAVFGEFDRAPEQEDPQGFVRRCAQAEARWQEIAAACVEAAARGQAARGRAARGQAAAAQAGAAGAAAFATGEQVELIAAALENDLEAAARVLLPGLERQGRVLVEAGAEAAGMSGSGPTFFGLCRSVEHAEEVAARLVRGGHRSRAVATCGPECGQPPLGVDA